MIKGVQTQDRRFCEIDAGCLMLDGQECTRNDIQKHPGSNDIANDFHHNSLKPVKHFTKSPTAKSPGPPFHYSMGFQRVKTVTPE
jgi:hypothetical protein